MPKNRFAETGVNIRSERNRRKKQMKTGKMKIARIMAALMLISALLIPAGCEKKYDPADYEDPIVVKNAVPQGLFRHDSVVKACSEENEYVTGPYGKNPAETFSVCLRHDGSRPVFYSEGTDDIVMTHYAVADFDSDGKDEYMMYGKQPTLGTYYLVDDDGTCLTYVTRDEFEEPEFYSNGMFHLAKGDWYGFVTRDLLDEYSFRSESFYEKRDFMEYRAHPVWFTPAENGWWVMKGTHEVPFGQYGADEGEVRDYLARISDGYRLDVTFHEF